MNIFTIRERRDRAHHPRRFRKHLFVSHACNPHAHEDTPARLGCGNLLGAVRDVQHCSREAHASEEKHQRRILLILIGAPSKRATKAAAPLKA
jgi:hypothetical protein